MSDKKNKTPESRTIRVGALARVEGEGALHLKMRDKVVEQVHLEIYEPPRFYEAFLRGRSLTEVPDITARICGICPIAYQMSSCYALEKAVGIADLIPPLTHKLRDLFYCGEWIESHVLHMFMLHLPDFLGYESAITMAADHGETVKRALRIKKLGNELVALLGARSVHPVGACVGGFYRHPEVSEVQHMLPEVKHCLGDMIELTRFLAKAVEYPDLQRDYEFLALRDKDTYSMNRGRIVSNRGLDMAQEEFLDYIEERHVQHSTALHAMVKGRGAYMVGPLARLNLGPEKLHPTAQKLLEEICAQIDTPLPWRNNFLSLLARGIETVHALGMAVDIMEAYNLDDQRAAPRVNFKPKVGRGCHGTEAPRGICWHAYDVKDDGSVMEARIIPPTSQNQMTIEEDLRELARTVADLPDEDAALRCEHLIRNYDPCISCSVHFLKFKRTWSEDSPRPLHFSGA